METQMAWELAGGRHPEETPSTPSTTSSASVTSERDNAYPAIINDFIVKSFERAAKEEGNTSVFADLRPRDLLNATSMEKIKLLDKLPYSACKDTKEMEHLEKELVQAGQQDLARYIRYASYSAQEDDSDDDEFSKCNEWCEKVIESDLRIRQITQRKAYLQESLDLYAESRGVSRDTANSWERELKDLKEKYLDRKREMWRLECNGIFQEPSRALTSLRDDPKWHLSAWLKKDCAKKGGCCARDCGCCEKVGHCTTFCSCCSRYWGFTDGKLGGLEDFQVEVDNELFGYNLNMVRACIWGVDFLNDMEFQLS